VLPDASRCSESLRRPPADGAVRAALEGAQHGRFERDRPEWGAPRRAEGPRGFARARPVEPRGSARILKVSYKTLLNKIAECPTHTSAVSATR